MYSPERPSRATARSALYALSAALLAIPLLAHAIVGWFSRYMADDYCTVGTLRALGFWGSQSFWYTTWSGRYTFTFLVHAAETVGVIVTRFLPALAILVWVIVAAFAFREAGRWVGAHAGRLGWALLAALMVFAILDGAPSPYQSLYWQTGMITYALPLVLITALAAWMLSAVRRAALASPKPWVLATMAGTTVLAGGLSETYAVLQIAVLAVGLVACWVGLRGQWRRHVMALFAAALLGAITALLVIYVAPGTDVRRGMISEPMGVKELTGRVVQDARIFLSRVVRRVPATLLLAVFLPAGLALGLCASGSGDGRPSSPSPKKLLPWLVAVPLATGALLLVSIAPYEFAVSDYPDARVLITSQFVLVAGMSTWGFLLGAALARSSGRRAVPAALIAAALSLLLVLASIAPATRRPLSLLPDARDFAPAWDKRDAELRAAYAAGADEAAVVSLPHIGGLAEIGYDPNEWVNRCVAQAYGLKRVIAK
jgi:hypothetical protein